jgi:hypothetical protein
MQRRFILFLAAAGVFIPALLLADTRGLVPQFVLGLATLTFLAVFARGSEVETRQIVCAIVVATTGEIVLSLGWGLYTYRHALIPLYVPFGHGLFYALAAESAQQPTLRRYARPITRAVLIGGSIIAGVSFIFFHDPWGLLWWIAAGILVMRSRNQLLLSACFTYTIILEWLGTAIGNWHWANVVPFVGLRSANPPSGVGILYILLDLITVAICSGMPTVVLSEALVPRGSHMGRDVYRQCGRFYEWSRLDAPDRIAPPVEQFCGPSLRLKDPIRFPVRIDLLLGTPEADGEAGEAGGAEGSRFRDAGADDAHPGHVGLDLHQ